MICPTCEEAHDEPGRYCSEECEREARGAHLARIENKLTNDQIREVAKHLASLPKADLVFPVLPEVWLEYRLLMRGVKVQTRIQE